MVARIDCILDRHATPYGGFSKSSRPRDCFFHPALCSPSEESVRASRPEKPKADRFMGGGRCLEQRRLSFDKADVHAGRLVSLSRKGLSSNAGIRFANRAELA